MTDLTEKLETLGIGEKLTLGRDDDADIVLQGDTLDAQHAEISRDAQGWLVRDLDSAEGTFLNGREVRGRTLLKDGDDLKLGDVLVPVRLRQASAKTVAAPVPGEGLQVTLQDVDKIVDVRTGLATEPKKILNNVSFNIQKGEFIGILGASGSGKSTVMKAIAGLHDISNGSVLLNGEAQGHSDLQNDRRIAYMPQDIIIHEDLTPRKALGYNAKLKGIGSSHAERATIIQNALDRVGVADRMDVPIRRLSGGQRKRVALAAELLGDPQLILLDEATSGLDPATEEDMMKLFRSLADEGRTVVCITHFPGRLALCDRILFLMDGRATFYGRPDELKSFFSVASIEDVYVRQHEQSAEQWRALYEDTDAGRLTASEASAVSAPEVRGPRPTFQNVSSGVQAKELTQRYFELLLADWKNVLLLFAQAPVIGLMMSAVFGSIAADFAEQHAANTKEVIFVLVLAVLWCSGTASVREIVREETVLRHESRFGVQLMPYIVSKLILLTVISLVQAASLLIVVKYFTELTGSFALQYLVLSATAIIGVLFGLLISSVSGTADRAMTILPVLLIAQAIFSGGVAQLQGIVEFFAQVFIPAYWALDGLRYTFASELTFATYPGAPGTFQPPILGTGGPLFLDFFTLGLQGAVVFLAAFLALRIKVQGVPIGEAVSDLTSSLRDQIGGRRKKTEVSPPG